MSFPQTQASQSVLRSQDYWRLLTELQSSGDIYEIDTSVRGLVIGPNSDLESVKVTYYDPTNSPIVNANELTVSVADPFLGRLDVLLDQIYPQTVGGAAFSAGSPARAFVSPADIVQNSFVPAAVVPSMAGDVIAFIRPRIDLLAYFADPSSVPIQRGERVINTVVPVADRGGGTGISFVVLPFYRRKTIDVRMSGVGGAWSLELVGVKFRAAGGFASLESGIATAPGVAAPLATRITAFASKTGQTSAPATVAPIGFFDYLYVAVAGPATVAGGAHPELSILATDDD